MLLTVLAASVLAAPKDAVMKIAGASMFKNGYVVVLREMDVPTSGAYVIKQIPEGSLGTVWISTSDKTKLKEVVNSLNEVDQPVKGEYGTLDQILMANKGKTLQFEVNQLENKRIWLTGKLLLVSSDLVFVDNGQEQFTIPRRDIVSIKSTDKLIYSFNQTVKTKVRGLRFEVETAAPGKVFMVSLERGITWAPAFALDISDPKKLVLTAKATAINDLEDMTDADFRFVTGFPNIRYAGIVDPLLMQSNADQFLGTISGGGGLGGAGGAPAGRAGEMMNQKAAVPMTADAIAQAMDMSGEGMQAGDLFFYTKQNLTLKRGERGMYMLFQSEAPYKEIYTWLVDDDTEDNVEYRFPSGDPGEVWHSVRFRNTSGQPLTTSAATTMKNGQILGQDMMVYTPAGAEAEVRITKALDIRVEKNEEEVRREPGVIKEKIYLGLDRNGQRMYDEKPLFDRLYIKGTLVIRNQKPEKVTVKVAKNLTGEVSAASHDAKVVKLAKGIKDTNPTSQITWQVDVDGGKTLNLTYEFSMLVRTQK
ncbi:MAG TPA: hypothetical protein VJ835_06135 [Fimbriimonadaceae bacterium]|nr:hypothetical protein [Fimbriimonadaceae bacterium]